jgi:hypothetical protein
VRTGRGLGLAIAITLAAAGGCRPSSERRAGPPPNVLGGKAALDDVRRQPHLLFVSTRAGEAFGKVGAVALSQPDGAPAETDLACTRVHYASGRGLCLVDARGQKDPPLVAMALGRDLEPTGRFVLDGPPSRVRMSANGRVGALTVFVVGESYACAFATKTLLVDPATASVRDDLKDFAILRGQRRLAAHDPHYWGVTFARDDARFFATLRMDGHTYLVAGDRAARTVTILREDVECPSLSPDGRHVAFKKATGAKGQWRLHVLDVETLADRPVAGETKNIDDQPEWLDDDHVVYGYVAAAGLPHVAANIWVAAIRGAEPSRIFVRSAVSPVVVRP